MEEALKEGKNPPHEVGIFPGADHTIFLAEKGFEYEEHPTREHAPGYLDLMSDWVATSSDGRAEVPKQSEIDIPSDVTKTKDVYSVSPYGTGAVQLGMVGLFLLVFLSPSVWLVGRVRAPAQAATRRPARRGA